MKKTLPFLPLKQLFIGKNMTSNVPCLQFMKNPSFLFLNHTQRMEKLGNGLTGNSFLLKIALFVLGTDPLRAMPSIQRLRRFLAFLHTDGRQHQNHRLWSDGTNQGTLFHLEQHLRKSLGALVRFNHCFLRMKKEN